ncbi:hypothetical protein M0Q97_05120 [Candidatus Dojkabacteria bacterium]|jgi:hypothetical protein|nr:hypothetical protein [Candidatus Dojkabacteria bacterium]
MKHIKKFSEDIEFAFDDEFEPMNYGEAFDKYINGQKVTGNYSNYPLMWQSREKNWRDYYAYIDSGLRFENGYSFVSHGGGCSGEDCNSSFIIDPNNKIIASVDW